MSSRIDNKQQSQPGDQEAAALDQPSVIWGTVEQVKGAFKEVAGKVMGNEEMYSQGVKEVEHGREQFKKASLFTTTEKGDAETGKEQERKEEKEGTTIGEKVKEVGRTIGEKVGGFGRAIGEKVGGVWNYAWRWGSEDEVINFEEEARLRKEQLSKVNELEESERQWRIGSDFSELKFKFQELSKAFLQEFPNIHLKTPDYGDEEINFDEEMKWKKERIAKLNGLEEEESKRRIKEDDEETVKRIKGRWRLWLRETREIRLRHTHTFPLRGTHMPRRKYKKQVSHKRHAEKEGKEEHEKEKEALKVHGKELFETQQHLLKDTTPKYPAVREREAGPFFHH